MGTEEGTCWDEHWVLYVSQSDSKLYTLKKIIGHLPDKHRFESHEKIFTNQIQQYHKRFLHHGQEGFIPGMQEWYNIYVPINMVHHINNVKDISHMIISIDTENASDKTHYSFMIKTLNKAHIEGM